MPWVKDRQANLVLFDQDMFSELSRLEGEEGSRQLLTKADVLKVQWDDPMILLDVDTPEDYFRLNCLAKNEPFKT